jgi:hypothetical protein
MNQCDKHNWMQSDSTAIPPCPYCKIAELEAERDRLKRACQHVAYYSLDNVPKELRNVCEQALQEGEDEK